MNPMTRTPAGNSTVRIDFEETLPSGTQIRVAMQLGLDAETMAEFELRAQVCEKASRQLANMAVRYRAQAALNP